MNNPRTVLVTGATGFVGQHLTRRLLNTPDRRLRILARDPKRAANIFGPATDMLDLRRGDLTRPDSLAELCLGVDTIFHCAIATLGTFDTGPRTAPFDAVNHLGTVHLAQHAAKAGVRRFVHVSSTAAMGTPDHATVDETTPCNPTTPYQRSKRAAEIALLDLHHTQNLGAIIARPCLVTGPGKQGGELLQLFKLCRAGRFPRIGAAGQARKPLIDVTDLVEGLILAAERGRPGELYLMHSGGNQTLGDILAAAGSLVGTKRTSIPIPTPAARLASKITTPLALALGRTPPLTPERLRLFLTDRHIRIDKARQELGFEPAMQALDAMLGRTHDWYRQSGQI